MKVNSISNNYQNINNTNKPSLGRSMIELLAVLAIIAIISAGGIRCISTVFDKNKADKIVKEVALQAEEIRNRRYVKDAKNVVYNGASDSVTARSYELKNGKIKYLILETSGVSKGVCQKLLSDKKVGIFETILTLNGNLSSRVCKGNLYE